MWDSQMVRTPSSARINQDVDLSFKALKIVYRTKGTAVLGLADINGHIREEIGEGESVSWGGAQTKGECCECKLTKNIFFHSDLLQFCLKKKRKITEFFPAATFFTI